MKLFAVTVLTLVTDAIAGPISVSNNVGDIVTVDFNANAVVSSNIDQNIISVIAALLNQQAIGISALVDAEGTADENILADITEESSENESPNFNIPPELIERVKGLFNKH